MPWIVTFFDVGQGDATDIALPCGEHILIDAGPCVGRTETGGGNALCEWFEACETTMVIREVVITHNHEDHFGGLLSLLECPNVQVKQVRLVADCVALGGVTESFRELIGMLNDRPAIQLRVEDNPVFIHQESELLLRARHPRTEVMHPPSSDPNATSMILTLEQVKTGEVFVVWAGDAKIKSVEKCCRGMCPGVMMGPHHGAPQGLPKSGDYGRVFKAIGGKDLYLSFGRDNSHQHPCVDYIKGARLANVAVTCSEVAKYCWPDCSENVYDGSGELGIMQPEGTFQCRGSRRIYVSASHGIFPDQSKADFLSAVQRKVPKQRC